MAELNYSKKRLEPVITKFGIDVENDKVFQGIVLLFPGQTDYQLWAIKGVYSKAVTLDALIHIKEWAEENPTEISHLSRKNLVSYKTKLDFTSLNREMESLDAVNFVRHTISRFNTNQRHILKTAILDPIEQSFFNALSSSSFKKYLKLFKDFETLPAHRQAKFISLMSAVNNIHDIESNLKKSLEASYEWNREDMLSFAQRCCPDTEVCFDQNNVVVLRIPSFASSQKLCGGGRTSWCLTREENYFNNYTTKNNNAQQFFLFDFNRNEKHELAHVGFSVNPQRGINYAHTTRNNSLMGGYNIDGTTWDINKVLNACKVGKNVYVRLKQLKNYKWSKESFLNKLAEWRISANQIDDNRFIIPVDNSDTFRLIADHTLCGSNILSSSSKTFIVVDFSKDLNDEKSILIFVFAKDKYEVLSFNKMYDAYGAAETKASVLGANHLESDMFVKVGEINPDILLHKYIDEENIAAATKLLNENPTLDPNSLFYGSIPVIKAITSRKTELFKAIANHCRFDMTFTEGFGEPYLQFIILYIQTAIENKKEELQPFFEMIDVFLSNEKYDINICDLNGDTALSLACEMPELSPIVERLVANPKCDVNLKNDWGFAPIDVALDNSPVNMPAIKALLTRQDLVIGEDTVKFAKEKNVDLEKIRVSVLEKGNNPTAEAAEKQEADKYADIFAKAFRR